jgi:predicted acyltransferase (DUF342 family)
MGGRLFINNNSFVVGGSAFSISNIASDASINSRLVVYSDVSFNNRLFVGDDVSLNKRLLVGGDCSFNGNVTFAILPTNQGSQLATKVFVSATAYSVLSSFTNTNANFNKNLYISGDVSANNRLFVGGDASFNGNVAFTNFLPTSNIGPSLASHLVTKSYVDTAIGSSSGQTVTNGASTFNGVATFNNNIVATKDVSMNTRLFVGSDASVNGNLSANVITCNELIVTNSDSNGGFTFFDIVTASGFISTNDVSLNTRLFVGGDVSMNSRLLVGSDVTLGGRLFINNNALLVGGAALSVSNIASDASINSRLTVYGDALLNTRLFVGGDASFSGNFYNAKNTVHQGDVTMNSRLLVGSDVTLGGRLFVNNNSFVVGGAAYSISNIASDASINGRLIVYSDVSLNTRLFVGGDLSVNQRMFVSGDVSLNGNVVVAKDITILGRLAVQQYSQQSIINTTTTNYTLIISEDLSLNNRLMVNGDVSMNSRLTVYSDVLLNTRLFVGGDASFGGNFYNAKNTIHQGDVTMNSRLLVGSDVTLGGRLFINNNALLVGGSAFSISNIASDASINSRLIVYSDVSLNTRLFVGGDVSLNNRLFVGGDVSMNSRLLVGSDVTLGGRLFINNNALLVGGSAFSISNIASDASINSRLTVYSDALLNTRLFVGGDASFGGNFYNAKNTVHQGDVSMNSRLLVGSDVTLGGRLFINNNSFVVGGAAFSISNIASDASVNSRLTVYSDALLNTRLFVGGDASFGGNFYNAKNTIHQGDVSMNSRLLVGSDVTLGGRLFINNNALLVGGSAFSISNIASDASINGRLIVYSDVSFNSRLFVSGDLSVNQRLFVSGDVSLNGNVVIAKDTLILGRLMVQQYSQQSIINTTTNNYTLIVSEDLSLNNRLMVNGDVSMNNRLTVYNDVSFNARLFVGNDVSFNGNLTVANAITCTELIINNFDTKGGVFFAEVITASGGLVSLVDVSINQRLSVGSAVTSGNNIVAIQQGTGSYSLVTSNVVDPFCINSSTITMGMGVDTTNMGAYINCGSGGTNTNKLFLLPKGGTVYMGSSNTVVTSDIRIKKNIQPLDNTDALNLVRKLNPCTFEYIDENFDRSKHIGFIAQEVNQLDLLRLAVDVSGTRFIPNIYCAASYDTSEQKVTLDKAMDDQLIVGDMVELAIQQNSDQHNYLRFTVSSVLSPTEFTIDPPVDGATNETKLFVFGKKVDDFLGLKKDMIFTVALSAVQKLDAMVAKQQAQIDLLIQQNELLVEQITKLSRSNI